MKKFILLFSFLILSISIHAQIIINEQPDALVVCDDDNDGYAEFNLHQADADITLGDESLIVTYHPTQSDAENGLNELSNPYQNDDPYNDVVFARVKNEGGSNFATVNLPLLVNPLPEIIQPINLFIDEGDGDGIAVFDLTVKIPEILNGLNPSEYSLYFYLTQADAENATNALANPESFYNTSNPQTIYVRVENFETGCFALTSFEILTDVARPDADGDGIANDDEDLNNNGNLNDDDTDGDGIPNYLDADDDGDNVATIDETTGIGAGFAPTYTFIDTDGDGIENYLDNDDDGDGTLTKDEDYNNNGTPIDDDTNNNGIPDFLDDSVFLAVNTFTFDDISVYPNPTSESFTVQSSKLISETIISVYDIQGKLLISEKMLPQNGTLNVDISALEIGVYFLKISLEGNTAMKKIIKK